MKRTFLFFLLIPMLAFTNAHKFYVSMTEMEYDSESQSLQVISRVFTDDMENLLRTRYSEDLYLTEEKEHPDADDFLQKYLAGKFGVVVNGEQKSFEYLGKRYDNDQLVFYLEIKEVEPIRKIHVQNEVLTDLFPDQKNVVHVTRDGKTKSLLLSMHDKSGEIKFGN